MQSLYVNFAELFTPGSFIWNFFVFLCKIPDWPLVGRVLRIVSIHYNKFQGFCFHLGANWCHDVRRGEATRSFPCPSSYASWLKWSSLLCSRVMIASDFHERSVGSQWFNVTLLYRISDTNPPYGTEKLFHTRWLRTDSFSSFPLQLSGTGTKDCGPINTYYISQLHGGHPLRVP